MNEVSAKHPIHEPEYGTMSEKGRWIPADRKRPEMGTAPRKNSVKTLRFDYQFVSIPEVAIWLDLQDRAARSMDFPY